MPAGELQKNSLQKINTPGKKQVIVFFNTFECHPFITDGIFFVHSVGGTMRRFALLLLIQSAFTGVQVHAQAFLKMQQPTRKDINTNTARQFMSGRTCAGCKVLLNNDSIHVYPNGVFALRRDLKPGKTLFVLSATDSTGKFVSRSYNYYFNPPPPLRVTPSFRIDYVTISPKSNALVSPGDTLRVRMKGYPGGKAYWFSNEPLNELPASQTSGIPGFYTGIHVVTEADSLLNNRISVYLKNNAGATAVLPGTYRYTYLRNQMLTGRTIDDQAYVTVSPDGDRLGPEKAGYLDRNVLLRITGKEDYHYKVQLSNKHFVYIPEGLVDTATITEPPPISIIDTARVWGDKNYDYVSVALSDKLPYLSTQEVNPGKIIVDVHGAYSEPDLVPELQSTGEISKVDWQQIEADVFRIVISLKHAQPWGYRIYYNGNTLMIRVKRQPASLQLKDLTIGLDAGHGGGNVGAVGPMGVYEKQLTLSLAMLVKTALEKEGAHVITTRNSDKFVDNQDRLLNYRQLDPDLLLSIHMNSSVNPVDIKGTATYFKYPFCEPLNSYIHKRLLETGLKDFKNNANFNFILNQPTEFPNTLIETLFLSYPEDEMKILDEDFRLELADKIVAGIKDFLQAQATAYHPIKEIK